MSSTISLLHPHELAPLVMTLPLITFIGPSLIVTFRSGIQWWVGVRTRRLLFPFAEGVTETQVAHRRTRHYLGRLFTVKSTPKKSLPRQSL
jgi:hypothetical protein